MSIKNEDILEAISKMNIIELIKLTKAIEKKFNISIPNINTNENKNTNNIIEKKIEKQTEYTVTMINFGHSKINIIKIVRTLLNLGLKEAKIFVETLPATIKSHIQKIEAEQLKTQFEEAGAIIEIK